MRQRASPGDELDGPAVDRYPLAAVELIAEPSRPAVYDDAALFNPALDLASRSEACICQNFLDSLGQLARLALRTRQDFFP